MANIGKNKDELVRIKRSLEMIKAIGFSREAVEYALLNVLPKDKDSIMVRYRVRDWGGKTAVFFPHLNMIDLSVEKCQEWVLKNSKDFIQLYNIKDVEKFKNYLSLFIILHEVEHAYQHLIGDGKLEAPCKLVKEGYKSLNNLLIKPNCVIPHPIKDVKRAISLVQYCKKQNDYVLERNANVDAFNALRLLAAHLGDEEMYLVFKNMLETCLTIGYEVDTKGCFYHTFKDLHMMNVFNKINNTDGLTSEDRVFYGVDIDDSIREKILEYNKKGRTI